MGATPASQFPNSFYRVELRAIRRQKVQLEMIGAAFAIFLVQLSIVIASIVRNGDHLFPGMATCPSELFEKFFKRFRIEFLWLPAINKFSVPKADCSEIANLIACWFMFQHWIFFLRRNPHAATRTVLLEMNFIDGP